jgi:hypothetical protein
MLAAPMLILAAAGPAAGAEPPRDALTVRLCRPDRQCERLIALFEGARAPHPAAALASWKRGGGASRSLGKPLEAAIAALNPEMARELRLLDGAELGIGLDAAGPLRWHAALPRDDGTFAALGTALVLTDGGSDPPLGAVPVDRLGPPGAPLMARTAGALVVAGTRDDLRAALELVPPGPPARPALETGVLVRLVPGALRSSGGPTIQRLAEALLAAGVRQLDGEIVLEGEALALVAIGQLEGPPPPAAARVIDPAWLDWVPASGVLGAMAAAPDPRPAAWDALFAAADRIEKADPARAQVAPLRTRLNLLSLAAGVRPEADLWPALRGVSAGVRADPAGQIDGALLALHAADPAAAERMARGLIPGLVRSLGVAPGDDPGPPEAGDALRLGRPSGRPLDLCRREATVLIAWGTRMLGDALDARDHPERSAGPAIRALWGARRPQRAGAFWPSRLSGRAAAGSPAASALAGAAPVLWWGGRDGRHLSRRDPLERAAGAGPPVSSTVCPSDRRTGVSTAEGRGQRADARREMPNALTFLSLCLASGVGHSSPSSCGASALCPPASVLSPPGIGPREGAPMRQPPPRLIDPARRLAVAVCAGDDAVRSRALCGGRGAAGPGRGVPLGDGGGGLGVLPTRRGLGAAGRPVGGAGRAHRADRGGVRGRLLMSPEDHGRWREDPEGLCWGVIGIEGFDALVRAPGDLDRLPGLFGRGVRLFQPVYAPTSLLGRLVGPRRRPGADRPRPRLPAHPGRRGVRALGPAADARPGPPEPLGRRRRPGVVRGRRRTSPAPDPGLQPRGPAARGLPRAPRDHPENLRRLRALGGTIGFGVSPPFYEAPEALRAGIEAAAALPFLGRPGYDGIALGTDFLGVDRTAPGLGHAAEVVSWVQSAFDPAAAALLIRDNARRLLARVVGVEPSS